MVDPMDKDTENIKDQSMGMEEYLECFIAKEKGKINQLDVGNEKDQHIVVITKTRLTSAAMPKGNCREPKQK